MVEVTDTNGCHNSSDVFDAILDASNVKENAVFSNLKIYPNPNNGEFTFSGFLNLPGEYKLEIKNTLGQVIYSDLLQQQNGNINETVHLKNVGSGVYMLMIKANNQSAVYRIVVH